MHKMNRAKPKFAWMGLGLLISGGSVCAVPKPVAKSSTKATVKAAPKVIKPTAKGKVATPTLPQVTVAPPVAAPVAAAPIAAPVVAAPVVISRVELPSGTKLQLELADDISSNKAQIGQEVVYFVKEAVAAPDGKVLVQKGARATGKVTTAKGARSFGRKGKLEFTVEEVVAADGSKIPLRSSLSKSGKGRGGTMVAVTALVTVFGVFIKGKNVTVPKATVVEAFVDDNVMILPATASASITANSTQSPPAAVVVPQVVAQSGGAPVTATVQVPHR